MNYNKDEYDDRNKKFEYGCNYYKINSNDVVVFKVDEY